MREQRGLTLERCTPRLRWMPEQFRHMNMPMFTLAQVGPRERQSQHFRLSSCFSRPPSTRLCSSFCALLTDVLLFELMAL